MWVQADNKGAGIVRDEEWVEIDEVENNCIKSTDAHSRKIEMVYPCYDPSRVAKWREKDCSSPVYYQEFADPGQGCTGNVYLKVQ